MIADRFVPVGGTLGYCGASSCALNISFDPCIDYIEDFSAISGENQIVQFDNSQRRRGKWPKQVCVETSDQGRDP